VAKVIEIECQSPTHRRRVLHPLHPSGSVEGRRSEEQGSKPGAMDEGPAASGRHEYLVAFASAPGSAEGVQRLAVEVQRVLHESGVLCAELLQWSGAAADRGLGAALLVTTSAAQFDEQAEHDEIMKLTLKDDSISGAPRLEIFTRASASTFAGYGERHFFSAAERAHMVGSLLDTVRAADDLCRSCVVMAGLASGDRTLAAQQQHEPLLAALTRCGAVSAVCPLHAEEGSHSAQGASTGGGSSGRRALWHRVCWQTWPLSPSSLPVHELRSYYGEQIAFYFAWLDFVSRMLLLPSVLAVWVWATRRQHEDVDNDVESAYYSLFMVLWGFVLLVAWRREANGLACSWDTLDLSHSEELNPSFHGELRRSKVTGEDERHYESHWRWLLHYPVSALVTLVMLGMAFAIMSLSLNLQGYVQPASPIFVGSLAAHSEPGAAFDAKHSVKSLVPVLLHTFVIMLLNTSYRHVAGWLTHQENHQWRHEFEASLIYKRFLFEAFDCYIALFYVAFYELDIVKLRGELVSLYTVDSLRRVGTESVLPYVLQQLRACRAHRELGRRKKNDDAAIASPSSADSGGSGGGVDDLGSVVDQLECDDYEQFDDYLEMVIQIGRLFASLCGGFPPCRPSILGLQPDRDSLFLGRAHPG
jgi:hypothetical protein